MSGGSNKCEYAYYKTYPSKYFHFVPFSFSSSSSGVSFLEHNTTTNPITTFRREITKAQPKPIFRLLPINPTPNAKAMAIMNKNPCSIIFIYFSPPRLIENRAGVLLSNCVFAISMICKSAFRLFISVVSTQSNNLPSKKLLFK